VIEEKFPSSGGNVPVRPDWSIVNNAYTKFSNEIKSNYKLDLPQNLNFQVREELCLLGQDWRGQREVSLITLLNRQELFCKGQSDQIKTKGGEREGYPVN
jgi:hypothetical protein